MPWSSVAVKDCVTWSKDGAPSQQSANYLITIFFDLWLTGKKELGWDLGNRFCLAPFFDLASSFWQNNLSFCFPIFKIAQ